MLKLKGYVQRSIFPLLLVFIVFLICLTNYTPKTFLSGWDTLHPEFDFPLNFQRLFFGVFRTEQGLGAIAAHSHMADLPRVLILYIFNFFLPLDFLRYSYIFANMFAGTIGMYFFLKEIIIHNKKAAFLGALFYVLNLGAIQTFNVPFEMFTTLFAMLPLIFYFATKFITLPHQKAKNLLYFSICILLAAPSAYAATLWYMFFGCFIVYFFFFSYFSSQRKVHLKLFLTLIISILVINSFWLLPNLYFLKTHGPDIQDAKINRLFSDQAFLKNKEFGNLNDILLLKSFYFDWSIYDEKDNKYINLLSPYIEHLKNPLIGFLGYVFALFFLFGLYHMVKHKRKESYPILAVLFICLVFIFNQNFPTGFIFELLRNFVPLFKEALRFPADKILNVYIFIFTIVFTASLVPLGNYFKGKKISKYLPYIMFLLIIIYSFPAFSGNYINQKMRVQIPQSYFDLFSYLKNQDDSGKVANLPIHSFWGWAYYDWYQDEAPSYQGAGFLYFGIKQPLLDRDFDRWNPKNEGYYREMSYAIYKEDKYLLSSVIKKFDISYIFMDRNVFDPQFPRSILYTYKAQALIRKTGLVLEEKNFGNITLFKIARQNKVLSTVNAFYNANPSTTTNYYDNAYYLYSSYLSKTNLPYFNNSNFSFRNIADNNSKLNLSNIKIESDNIIFYPNEGSKEYQIGNLSDNFSLIPIDLGIEKSNNLYKISFYPNTPMFDTIPSATSLRLELPLAKTDVPILALNRKNIFDISQIDQNTPTFLGKTFLNNGLNSISIFSSNSTSSVNSLFSKINPFFSACDQTSKSNPYSLVGNNSLTLSGKENMCITIPLSFLKNEKISGDELLANFSFNYNSNLNTYSCLQSMTDSSCLYYKDAQDQEGRKSFTYSFGTKEIDSLALKIFIENNTNRIANANLSGLSLSFASPKVKSEISADSIKSLFIKNKNLSFSQITQPRSVSESQDITMINKLENDCLLKQQGAVKQIITGSDNRSIRYSSQKGSFCDHFSYKNLPHKQGYFVFVKSKNETGLPITICVTNYTSRKCDIYADLSKGKNQSQDIFLLPPMDPDGIGYDVNIENIGINGSPAINYLYSIKFVPIPYEVLQNIRADKTTFKKNEFIGKIEDFRKINPSQYLIKTDGNPLILNLSYSFEDGFKAYSVPCYDSNLICKLRTYFPMVFGKEIKVHSLINNWSNGWITDKGSQFITVVFIPQYLEYIGLLLLLIYFIKRIISLKK